MNERGAVTLLVIAQAIISAGSMRWRAGDGGSGDEGDCRDRHGGEQRSVVDVDEVRDDSGSRRDNGDKAPGGDRAGK